MFKKGKTIQYISLLFDNQMIQVFSFPSATPCIFLKIIFQPFLTRVPIAGGSSIYFVFVSSQGLVYPRNYY